MEKLNSDLHRKYFGPSSTSCPLLSTPSHCTLCPAHPPPPPAPPPSSCRSAGDCNHSCAEQQKKPQYTDTARKDIKDLNKDVDSLKVTLKHIESKLFKFTSLISTKQPSTTFNVIADVHQDEVSSADISIVSIEEDIPDVSNSSARLHPAVNACSSNQSN